MRNRPQRILRELYDLEKTVDEQEMEPATEDSSRNPGSLEKLDREPQKFNSDQQDKFTDQNRVVAVGDMRVESGTCNVCSAPCSSCMHRLAAAMESNADCGSSDNTFLRKDADSCSVTGVEHISSNHPQTAASDLLSASSSNDSYSENVESKETLRNFQTCCTSEDADMPLEGSEVYIDNGQKSILFPDNEGDKATPIRSSTSSGEIKNEDQCFESPTGFGRLESSLHETGTQHQPIVHAQASEPDLLDVNVCDICGDAGREEFLATCSRCPDGAEHTYCMRIMLKKVPEGDWLCEECQLKEEAEVRRLNKERSGVQSLDEKIENLRYSPNMESSLKLNNKSTDPVTCGSNKEMQSPRTTTKRCLDQKDVALTTGKKICATKDQPLKTTSPRMGATFSRENSLKSLHVAEPKRTSMASPPGDQSTSTFQISRSLALDSRENLIKNFHTAELKRTNIASVSGANRPQILSRSLTLDSKYSNVQKELYSPRGSLLKHASSKKDVEPKVKKLVEDVPSKLSKESAMRSPKRPALLKTISKSMSFKSVGSGHHTTESIKVPRSEDHIRFKQIKEKNAVERKSSFIIDRSLMKPKHIPKLDLKIAPLHGDSNYKLEHGNPGSSKGFDTKNNIGSKELKKQPSFKLKSQGTTDSENKKAGEFVDSEAVLVNSNAANILHKDAGGVTRGDVSISADPSHTQFDGKSKCASGASRTTMSEHNHLLVQVPEASHAATQSCQTDKLNVPAAKPYADKSLVDGTGKRNKWKDAIKAAMSSAKNSKTVDKSENRLLSNSLICEDPSRISSMKNLPMEGAPHETEIFKILHKDAGGVTRGDVSISADPSHTQFDGKSKCASGASRTTMSEHNHLLVQVPEASHAATQSCQTDKLNVPAAKAYADKSLVDGTGKRNKWKDAVEAAMSSAKNSKTVDKSENRLLSNSLICEDPSRISSMKNLPLEGAPHETEIFKILHKDDCGVSKGDVSISADPSHTQFDGKSKCASGASRTTMSEHNHLLVQVPGASHAATQSCQTDKLNVPAAKPYADESLVDGTGKRNKWKDAVKAAMSSAKNSKTVDKSENRLLSNSLICEDPSRISSMKNLRLEVAPHETEIFKIFETYCSKTESIDKKEQAKLSNEFSCVPGVGDQNANPTNSDEFNEKSLTQNLPDHSSLLKSVTVPVHEFIWQGAFEIIRIGRLPETVGGIQAHLSIFSSPKVHEIARKFPCKIQLEEVPRVSLWPLQFQDHGPKENNIALYFFARDAESYEKSYEKLLEGALKNDLALKGSLDEVELLIFPSSMLPENSQRWNMLFFLWGVFRVRKQESSKPYANLKEEPCESKKSTGPLIQELPTIQYKKKELPTIQKYDFNHHPPKALSESKELCSARIVNSSVLVRSVSSTGPDSIIHKAKVIPSVGSSLCKASVETEGSDSSDHISHSYPGSYSNNHKETCSTNNSSGTKQGSLNNEIDAGKVSHTHANSAQEEFVGSLPGFSVTSSFKQDNGRSKEIKKQDRLVKIEVDSEEKIKEIDCVSWSSKPSMKRTHAYSYHETTESTKANMWQPKANFFSVEDGREHKKMKWESEGHVIGSYRDQHMEFVSASKIQPPLTGCLYKQQHQYGANYNNVIPGSSKCAETSFFPVNQMTPESNDSFPDRSDILQNFRHFLPPVPVDKKPPESNDAPDLELALGGKRNSSEKEMLPLFYPLADKGRLDKPSSSAVDEGMSGSLSLSLSFPGIEKKRNEDHVGKDDQSQRCTKKSLILFGGVIESFNPS